MNLLRHEQYFSQRSLMKMCSVVILCVSLTVLSLGSVLARTKQVTTWSDFGRVRDVAVSHNYAYFATAGGLIRYDKLQSRWGEPLTSATGLDNFDIQRVAVDQFDQQIVASTNRGHFLLSAFLDRWSTIDSIPSFTTVGTRVSLDRFLLAPPGYTYGGNAIFTNPAGTTFQVVKMVDDGNGTVWAGSWGHGPAIVSSTSNVTEFLPYGLLSQDALALWEERDTLWIGGTTVGAVRTGLSIFNRADGTFRYLESGIDPQFPAEDILSLAGNTQSVYIGTGRGLYIYDRSEARIIATIGRRYGLDNPRIRAIAPRTTDNNTICYLGTERGLAAALITPDSTRVVQFPEFSTLTVYDLELIDSSLWIGTNNGAYRYVTTSGRLQRFSDRQLALSGDVFTLQRFENELWLATNDGAVRIDLATGEHDVYRYPGTGFDGRGMAVGNRYLALSSTRGILVVDLADERARETEYRVSDGLPSDQVQVLHFSGSTLWVGTPLGLSRIELDE